MPVSKVLRKKMKRLAFALLFSLFGCSAEEIISINLEGVEINEQAPQIFSQKGIWYKQLKDGRFQFKESDIPKVKTVMFEVREAIIPFGYSASYGPEMEAIVLDKVRTVGVSVEVRQYDGNSWIVWQPGDEDTLRRIEREAREELSKVPIQSGKL